MSARAGHRASTRHRALAVAAALLTSACAAGQHAADRRREAHASTAPNATRRRRSTCAGWSIEAPTGRDAVLPGRQRHALVKLVIVNNAARPTP